MSSDVVSVSPSEVQWRLSIDMETEPLDHERWTHADRHPLAESQKYRSIVQRYLEGRQWDDTPLFQEIYKTRLAYEPVRGCSTMAALLTQYHTRVDAMFADLRAHGFRRRIDGRPVPPIRLYLSHDNVLLMGNQGNHRIAMAQILRLDSIIAEIVGRHPQSGRSADLKALPPDTPRLPVCAQAIPAMTTDAERICYYRLAQQQDDQGAIVELGAWLGAATAYLAAGVRDVHSTRKVQVYDRFIWKPSSHEKKAGGPLSTSQFEAFRAHLGPLLDHVDTHTAEVGKITWSGGPVSLLVCDAPKRLPEISKVLTVFAPALRTGSLMAWQDFAYFPSYDIPAALMRLGDRRLEFTEAVYPGTTAVFRVREPWSVAEVTPEALSLQRWSADDVERAWDTWTERLPPQMRPRFACGAVLFLCDLGAVDRAKRRLRSILAAHEADVLPKWQYLLTERAELMKRYQPLVEVLPACV